MKLKIFTVHDAAVEAYLQPFYMQSTGAAVRSFGDTVNTRDHHFAKHPADYTLFEIGEFDDQSCEINILQTFVPLGRAIDFVKQQDLDLNQPDLPSIIKNQSGDK